MAQIRPLTVVDTALLDYQFRHADLPINVNCLLLARGPAPSLDDLREFIAMRLHRSPPLTERLVVDPRNRARYGWLVDSDVDLARLVQERTLGHPVGSVGSVVRDVGPAAETAAALDPHQLGRAVEELSARPVPFSGPPWRIWLLHSPGADEFALFYSASHVQQDGTARNLVLTELFDAGRNPAFVPPQRRAAGRMGARGIGMAVARSLRWLGPVFRPHTLAGPWVDTPVHGWASTSLTLMRAIGSEVDATVNDVFLAALAGAMRDWLTNDPSPTGEVGHPPHPVHPMHSDDSVPGDSVPNGQAGNRRPGPVSLPDPRRQGGEISVRGSGFGAAGPGWSGPGRSGRRLPDVGGFDVGLSGAAGGSGFAASRFEGSGFEGSGFGGSGFGGSGLGGAGFGGVECSGADLDVAAAILHGGMPAAMAVSTRLPGERVLLANFVAGARVGLPCWEPSPLGRLLRVRAQTGRLKQSGSLGAGERLFFELLPIRLRHFLFAATLSGRAAALSVSNQAGPPGPLAVLGRPITHVIPVPILFPGQRLACHLSGTRELASIGIAAETGRRCPRDLARLWAEEVEVLAREVGLRPASVSVPAR